jgi:hypothetical protein
MYTIEIIQDVNFFVLFAIFLFHFQGET